MKKGYFSLDNIFSSNNIFYDTKLCFFKIFIQSNNGEDEEQQDYESDVDSDECSEDTLKLTKFRVL